MPWVRLGDTASTHPVVLAASVVSGADTRTRNELVGFVALLGTLSAAHLTDSVVEVGAVYMVGGPDTDRLVAQSVEAGLLSPAEVDGRQAWKIVNDPAFMHIRTRAEVEWDRARKRDNGNTTVTVEVQRRDGSACRYCGQSVNWSDRVGGRGATYDHVTPPPVGQPAPAAASPDDLVVACRSCNSSRGAAHRDGQLAAWDAAHPRRPVPAEPFYCEYLAGRLGLPASDTALRSKRPRSQRATAPTSQRPDADQSAGVVRPARPDTALRSKRPRSQRATAPTSQRPGPADTAADADPTPGRAPPDLGDGYGSQLPGTGRARSGLAGEGRSSPARRRRSRRKRARNSPGTEKPQEGERS